MEPLLPRMAENTKIYLQNDIHDDDRLYHMIASVRKVREKGMWTVSDRIEFLVTLQEEIQSFISDFLPHLVEEEEVRYSS